MEEATGVISSAEGEDRCWSDLPLEILNLILSHLFAGDCSMFRATCRSWRSASSSVIRSLSPHVDSPCLMYASGTKCTLFNPIYNTTYSTDMPELSGAVIRSSKHGWLLVSRGYTSVFFFNPFTKVSIGLPDSYFLEYGIRTMWFSSPPTCPDCVVVVYTDCVIGTISRGEGAWNEFYIHNTRRFEQCGCNPILHEGRYYILGAAGRLGIFDPMGDFEQSCPIPGKNLKGKVRGCLQSYFVENDGDLLAVCVGSRGGGEVRVFKLDTQAIAWEEVKCLGDKMLYISRAACFSETAVVRGTGNKIYFPRLHGDKPIFYSLATRKYHSFDGDYSNKQFFESSEFTCCTWIKPTVDATTCYADISW